MSLTLPRMNPGSFAELGAFVCETQLRQSCGRRLLPAPSAITQVGLSPRQLRAVTAVARAKMGA